MDAEAINCLNTNEADKHASATWGAGTQPDQEDEDATDADKEDAADADDVDEDDEDEDQLQINITTLGTGGPKVPKGAKVKIHFTMRLKDNTFLGSSRTNNEPIEFILGQGTYISGFDEGICEL